MPAAYGRNLEPLCKGGCGKTVRETIEDLGYCRKCLYQINPAAAARKRTPRSEVNPLLERVRYEHIQGVEGEPDILVVESLSELQTALMDQVVAEAKADRPLSIDLVSEAERLVAYAGAAANEREATMAELLRDPTPDELAAKEEPKKPARKRPAAKPKQGT